MAIDQDCRYSLLYVEDESETRENLAEIIGRLFPDVRLLLAENGVEGMELFTKQRPDLVITDINMPVSSGLKMASEIKAVSPATEVIALTAYSHTEYLLAAIETGVSHYLLKPVDVRQIAAVIGKALASVRSERLIARQNEVIRNLNAQLSQKAADLEFANQELETFNYTVAHDLRSPLANISGYAQLLLATHAGQLDLEGKGHLHVISQEVERMKTLIGALLRFSQQTQKFAEKKPADLSTMVQEIRDILLQQKPQREVSFSIEAGVRGVCDADLVRIALENLIGNAWKFSAPKGGARIEFGTISNEDDLVYFVRDNGVGFDLQQADRLFVPFHRLHGNREFEGCGIGLATAAKIIQRHGGRVWAEAKEGEGATFFFTL
jgi:two-component system, sensor histidine kinase and response regulator